MFEGKPPLAQHAQFSAAEPFADEELAAFSWDELIARLSAVQELRLALAKLPLSARASFDSLASGNREIRSNAAEMGNKPVVNPVASANGKGTSAKDGSWADDAHPTVRGIA